MTHILVYGKNEDILNTVIRLINKEETWHGEGTTEEERIIELLQNRSADVLLLGGGISEQSEKRVRILTKNLSPGTIVVQHYGGGSGLLKYEIESALKDAEQQLHILDNPFD